jgi:hypothetical protein
MFLDQVHGIARTSLQDRNPVRMELVEKPIALHTRSHSRQAEHSTMDSVSIFLPTCEEAEALAKAFWMAMGRSERDVELLDLVGQLTGEDARTNIRQVGATWKFTVHGNWLPLTQRAWTWLRENTKLLNCVPRQTIEPDLLT